jgi:hypothetical protein
MRLTEKKERGSPAPLQREKNLEIKRESIMSMFGSFPPSPLVGLRLQSVLGPGRANIVYGIITLKPPDSDTSLCPIRGVSPRLSARSSSSYYNLISALRKSSVSLHLGCG